VRRRAVLAPVVVLLVASSCAAEAGAGARAAPPAPKRVGHDSVSVVLSAGWRLASRSLTPKLVAPREVLSAGTGRLPVGGGPVCGDAYLPARAVRALRPGDALVSLQESAPSRAFPRRPRTFRRPSGDLGCAVSIESHWIPFRDGGRGFYAFVAIGRDAAPGTRAAAWRILDSLRVRPASAG
jgi:hypothetical protein